MTPLMPAWLQGALLGLVWVLFITLMFVREARLRRQEQKRLDAEWEAWLAKRATDLQERVRRTNVAK